MTEHDRLTLGLVLDLDGTLAPDTTTQYLACRSIDTYRFWADVRERMRLGWDQVPAYLYGIARAAKRPGSGITEADMTLQAAQFDLFPGAADVIPRLQRHAVDAGARLEAHLVSSGLAAVIRGLPFASGSFEGVWSSEFHYDGVGRPAFPKRVVSFTDKTRPLVSISKGITQGEAESDPSLVNAPIPVGQLRVPFRRMIFVGDGLTDIPCFAMVTNRGGTAVAVHDAAGDRSIAETLRQEGRVAAVAAADYTDSGEAYQALVHLIDGLTEQISQGVDARGFTALGQGRHRSGGVTPRCGCR